MTSKYLPVDERDEVFLDTETTGLDPVVNEIVEFAAIKRNRAGKVVATLKIDVRALYANEPPPWAEGLPGFDRETWAEGIQYALKVNGLTLEEVTSEDRADPDEAAVQIADFLKNCTLIGQNPSFDVEFLKQMMLRSKVKEMWYGKVRPVRLPYHKIDVVTLAYVRLVPDGLGKLSLTKEGGVCEFLGIPIEGAHTAMGDVVMTMAAYDAILRGPTCETQSD
jgi:DNA polymerase III epsilon subunit-like protein